MKLMTKEIEQRLEKFPLYSQDGKGEEATIVCKFFCPINSWTWYVLEAERKYNGDYEFFGIVINGHGDREYGYFLLSELQAIKLPFRMGIERDIYFTPKKVKDVIQN